MKSKMTAGGVAVLMSAFGKMKQGDHQGQASLHCLQHLKSGLLEDFYEQNHKLKTKSTTNKKTKQLVVCTARSEVLR